MKNKILLITIAIIIIASSSIAQVTGTFTDSRDGKTYKTVIIGTQTWMAENLNFNSASGCWCYDNDTKNCSTYGRLDTYDEALKACPAGWHLPDDAEWKLLASKANAGNLKATGYDAWTEMSGTPSSSDNKSGFTALPGGCYVVLDNSFSFRLRFGLWWSKTIYDEFNAKVVDMQKDDVTLYNDMFYNKKYGLSVRCVRD